MEGRTTTAKLQRETGIPRTSLHRWVQILGDGGIIKTELIGAKVKRVVLTEKLFAGKAAAVQ